MNDTIHYSTIPASDYWESVFAEREKFMNETIHITQVPASDYWESVDPGRLPARLHFRRVPGTECAYALRAEVLYLRVGTVVYVRRAAELDHDLIQSLAG